jgi:hypothetical protein
MSPSKMKITYEKMTLDFVGRVAALNQDSFSSFTKLDGIHAMKIMCTMLETYPCDHILNDIIGLALT